MRPDWGSVRRVVAPTLRRLERATNGQDRAHGDVPVFYPRAAELPRGTAEQRALADLVESRSWYHTIDLGQGIRTPGMFDHPPALRYYPLPERLDGWRCLDVATLDGFWAFEMERRGAAEVVALDIESWHDLDLPPYALEDFARRGLLGETGGGFRSAAEVLESRVNRRICNVYDLGTDAFGQFDLVFCSDLLIHLRNPHGAIQNIYAVTRPGGEAIFVEPHLSSLDALGPDLARLRGDLNDVRWWEFSRGFLEKAILLAGFERVELHAIVDIRIRTAPDIPSPRAILRAKRGGEEADLR